MVYTSLIKAFEKEKGWIGFQIASFNKFINYGIESIINEIGKLELSPEAGSLELRFGKIEIGTPSIKEADGSTRQIFPNEARVRNLTYSASMWMTITPVVNNITQRTEKVHIGNLPIMIQSCLCSTNGLSNEELVDKGEDPNDPGGYFIINGTERVLVLIEEIASNKPIFERSDELITVRINSERSGFKQRHVVERKPDGEITISFANIRKLSVITLLRALGFETDKEICENISDDQRILNELYVSLYHEEASNSTEAIEQIGRKLRVAEDYRLERVNQILDRYLLPHVGQETNMRKEKAEVLAKIIKKVIALSMDMIPEDDIDHYANKRLLMSGELVGQLFRSILLGRWGLLAKMSYNYQKLVKRGKKPSIQGIVEADAMTKQILSSLATGNWIGGRTGVSQRLDRSSYVKTISHLRTVISPLTSTQEHFRARQVHPTEWGRLDPAETPEGSSIGLRKHLTMITEITPGMDEGEQERVLKSIIKNGEG